MGFFDDILTSKGWWFWLVLAILILLLVLMGVWIYRHIKDRQDAANDRRMLMHIELNERAAGNTAYSIFHDQAQLKEHGLERAMQENKKEYQRFQAHGGQMPSMQINGMTIGGGEPPEPNAVHTGRSYTGGVVQELYRSGRLPPEHIEPYVISYDKYTGEIVHKGSGDRTSNDAVPVLETYKNRRDLQKLKQHQHNQQFRARPEVVAKDPRSGLGFTFQHNNDILQPGYAPDNGLNQ